MHRVCCLYRLPFFFSVPSDGALAVCVCCRASRVVFVFRCAAVVTDGPGLAGDTFDANKQERALQASILSAAQHKKVAKKQKPAWAYTAEAKEKEEEEEADELLRFAESLNFDEYLDNLEVRQAMEQARAQLEALERERVEEEEAAAAAEDSEDAEGKEEKKGEGEEGEATTEKKRVVPLTADSLRRVRARGVIFASGWRSPGPRVFFCET